MNSATAALRTRLADELEVSGKLRDPEWRRAVLEVPREAFVPEFYRQQPSGEWETVTSATPSYLEDVYADRALTTQLTAGNATSSSSQPSLMVAMLEALEVKGDMNVLEIATGSGYNAALLSARLGGANVVTVEVDGGLVDLATQRLKATGHTPTVIHGDGREGYSTGAPYDRLIATVGMDTIPPAWLAQVRPGGLIVTPLGWGNVRLVVSLEETAMGKFLPGGSYFMTVRDSGSNGNIPYPGQPETLTKRPAVVAPAVYWAEDEFRFLLSLVLPNVGSASEGNGTIEAAQLWAADGSWARVEHGEATQGGPRRLWDAVEAAHVLYEASGRPTRDRYGVTATSTGHHVWLDEPSNVLRLC